MKKELTKEELYTLARMIKGDVAVLSNLKDFLDTKKIRRELIQYEFKHLVKEKTFRKRQIIMSLMKKYDASKSYIELIVYNKKANNGKPCARCGKPISAYKWNRNSGVCDSCITKAINQAD